MDAKAITLYESLIKTDNNNLIWKYQLAKLNALNGNKNKALDWLETITEAGWDKVLVMRYDPVWANYKGLNKWKKMESEWMKPR